MAFKNFIFGREVEEDDNVTDEDEYYTVTAEEARSGSSNKMILVEPRAYSESQAIADHLKARKKVVVNFKRVTADQQRRIIDFISGTLYAINGDLQKVGDGIYLCTPKNIDVQGEITEETEAADSEEW